MTKKEAIEKTKADEDIELGIELLKFIKLQRAKGVIEHGWIDIAIFPRTDSIKIDELWRTYLKERKRNYDQKSS